MKGEHLAGHSGQVDANGGGDAVPDQVLLQVAHPIINERLPFPAQPHAPAVPVADQGDDARRVTSMLHSSSVIAGIGSGSTRAIIPG